MNQQEQEFLFILEKHKGILYKVAKIYCKDIDYRNDLIQQIILQMWKSFTNYKEEYKHSTWIYSIALNVAISFVRKEKTREIAFNSITKDMLNSVLYEELSHQQESQIQILHQFISELKELDKAIMLLYLEEKSYQEIASIIGISESNVGTKISRIKIELRKKFTSIKEH